MHSIRRAWASLKRPYIAVKYRNHDALMLVGDDGIVTRFHESVRRLAKMTPAGRLDHYRQTYHPMDAVVIAPFLEALVGSYTRARHGL